MRGWLLAAAALLILALYSTTTAVFDSGDVNWLLQHGKAVDAAIFVHDQAQLPNLNRPPDEVFNFRFEWNGKQAVVVGKLPEQTEHVITGHTTVLHVDPDNLDHWTARTKPMHWWDQITLPIVLMGIVIALLVVTILLRQQRLRTYRFGTLLTATVVDTRSNPLTPLSTSIRCSVEGRREMIVVSLPRSRGRVMKGETIELIAIPQRPDRALAAANYL